MAEYIETDEGQFAAGAHRYLSAASLLMQTDEYRERRGLLTTPILHLLGHGSELLLKHSVLRAGATVEDVRKAFGHDLMALWKDGRTESLRAHLASEAVVSWQEAEATGEYKTDWTRDPVEAFLQMFEGLARLHGRELDYPLRYVTPVNTLAPTPWHLRDTLAPVAERVLKNPAVLDYAP